VGGEYFSSMQLVGIVQYCVRGAMREREVLSMDSKANCVFISIISNTVIGVGDMFLCGFFFPTILIEHPISSEVAKSQKTM
jgi:hypothetical protein